MMVASDTSQRDIRCAGEEPSMETSDRAARQQRADAVIEALKRTYPDAECALAFTTPLDLIVATILSAQCTDERVNIVTADLFQKYRSASNYASADPAELEHDIHSTGFFRQKAKAIRGMAQMLLDRFDGEVPPRMEDLTELPGVARKTANVVLGTAFGIPEGITVDTHVRRLAERMGLSGETDPNKIERDLMALVPREEWIWFGHAMILHGRQICHARQPECARCPLEGFCPKGGLGAGKPRRAGSRGGER
jgi:endonuclease-3